MTSADKALLAGFLLAFALLADKVAAQIAFALYACGAC